MPEQSAPGTTFQVIIHFSRGYRASQHHYFYKKMPLCSHQPLPYLPPQRKPNIAQEFQFRITQRNEIINLLELLFIIISTSVAQALYNVGQYSNVVSSTASLESSTVGIGRVPVEVKVRTNAVEPTAVVDNRDIVGRGNRWRIQIAFNDFATR